MRHTGADGKQHAGPGGMFTCERCELLSAQGVDTDELRDEFVRLLTQDSAIRDRRRKDFNQALFFPPDEPVPGPPGLGLDRPQHDHGEIRKGNTKSGGTMKGKIISALAALSLVVTVVGCGTSSYKAAHDHNAPAPTVDKHLNWVWLDSPGSFDTIVFACHGNVGLYETQDSNLPFRAVPGDSSCQ